ncbi:MAG TPA: DUF1080 domain-containing protein [Candidatus Acidoferrales bacterium]|nr:DUF1080 domain-containing protein [Candidatus Acidoferrales bacterium]
MTKLFPAILLCAVLVGCSTKSQPVAPAPVTPPPPKPASQATPTPPPMQEIVIDGVAGFQDTPMQPDGKWHVHDPARPQPPVVTPGTFSTGATPPSDAIVLFNGTDLSNWRDRRTGGPAPWKIEDGAMVAVKDDIQTTNEFGDMQLHVEFCEPEPGNHSGQDRGNSGVFLMGRYEIQVLDCYHSKTYADGATAAIYGQHPPLVNPCRPPGEWQTYDIAFTTPRFDANGELQSPGYVTVFFNGVLVQNHQSIRGTTNWRVPGKYEAHGPTGPLGLQFHNHPVKFRNLWVRPITEDNEP